MTTDYDYDYNIENNIHDIPHHGCYWGNGAYTFYVLTLVVSSIGLPLTLAAIFAIYSLVRRDHVAPIYVINLLITDLVQVCSMIILVQEFSDWRVCHAFFYIHHLGVMVSVSFMVVVCFERYLAVVWPVWYRCRRSIKTSVVVCVVMWILPFLYLPIFLIVYNDTAEIVIAVFLLLPFPLFIFFLVGTVKALSTNNGVSSDEKRRILAIQVLVLLIYTLLYLPRVVFSLEVRYRHRLTFELLTIIPVHFSPLADLFIYIFMRKGNVDRLLASLCPSKMEDDNINILTANEENVATVGSAEAEGGEVEKTDGEV
ncbi:G-protein coupled receptor 4-like [Cololabis saira]|uniref:G-protein coupled receptor 4-like n=1 Tax=Cololabis saira TaxID=129043 RepID=UPI002AD56A4B|nr:G-protein coupled receptor 4-like [Cololabis saira]